MLRLPDPCQRLPFVRVRGSRAEQLGLFKKLDRGRRLPLVPEEDALVQEGNGLFSVFKDLNRDRLILDARRPIRLGL